MRVCVCFPSSCFHKPRCIRPRRIPASILEDNLVAPNLLVCVWRPETAPGTDPLIPDAIIDKYRNSENAEIRQEFEELFAHAKVLGFNAAGAGTKRAPDGLPTPLPKMQKMEPICDDPSSAVGRTQLKTEQGDSGPAGQLELSAIGDLDALQVKAILPGMGEHTIEIQFRGTNKSIWQMCPMQTWPNPTMSSLVCSSVLGGRASGTIKKGTPTNAMTWTYLSKLRM